VEQQEDPGLLFERGSFKRINIVHRFSDPVPVHVEQRALSSSVMS
jgi:hypothetical protein